MKNQEFEDYTREKLIEIIESYRTKDDKSEKRKRWFLRRIWNSFKSHNKIGNKLVDSMEDNISDLRSGKIPESKKIASLIEALLERVLSFGKLRLIIIGITLIPSLITLLVIVWQAKLLQNQNELIKIQNRKVEDQNFLEESSRRSGLIFELSSILDEIDEEIDVSTNENLSPLLTGRIIALSKSLKPYKYLDDNGNLILNSLSPERGQLLIALVNSNLSIQTYNEIFQKGDFSFSDLKGVRFENAYLSGINLSEANLSSAKLIDVELDSAIFAKADLTGIQIKSCVVSNVVFYKANCKWAYFFEVRFKDWADFSYANLSEAVFEEVEFGEMVISSLYQKDDISCITFLGANLSETNFKSCDIPNKNWITEIKKKSVDVIGRENICNYLEVGSYKDKNEASGGSFSLMYNICTEEDFDK